MSPAGIALGLQYADAMNLAAGILDSAGEYIKAMDAVDRAKEDAAWGDFEPFIGAWERCIEARSAAMAWATAYRSRGYVTEPLFPLTPAEIPT